MKLRIYSTTAPFKNKDGQELQGYYFATNFGGEVKHMCLYSESGLNIGDYAEVGRSKNTGNYFIANKKEK